MIDVVAQKLLVAIAITALGLTAYVVIIGGIACLIDDSYGFAQYLHDLDGVYKLLGTGLISIVAHA